jgi:diguanylate cyclase (GGDEF)-like protein
MSAVILVADDDPFNLRLLTELCQAAGYTVQTCANGREVLDMVARERPDLILLDVQMPELDGFEVLRILKSDPELASIPIIMVTASGEVDARERGIELGAEDYITKPFRVFEIQQRIRNALRVSAAETEAQKARELARDRETVDSLTRAGTSQQLLITVDYEFTRAARYKKPLSCMVVRITNYVDLVETAGREAGEGALVRLASSLRECIRGIDHLFRSDLEEFTVLLPETPADGAGVVRGRVESQLADRTLFGAAISPEPKLGIGVASLPDDTAADGNALVRLALSRAQ